MEHLHKQNSIYDLEDADFNQFCKDVILIKSVFGGINKALEDPDARGPTNLQSTNMCCGVIRRGFI